MYSINLIFCLVLPNNVWCTSGDTRVGRQTNVERKNFVLYPIDICAAGTEEHVFIAYLRKVVLQMQTVKFPSAGW
jgi:hypothetical protein